MSKITKPSLFGIEKSNRDFTQKDSWGKNKFNSSFPVSLACYMGSKGLKPKYLKLSDKMKVVHDFITVENLFGLKFDSKNLYFAFESNYVPYQKFVSGKTPRIDVVTLDSESNFCQRGLEIKLTALPDNSTCYYSEQKYGCEIVTRPNTIVYMALNLSLAFEKDMADVKEFLAPFNRINDWTEGFKVLPHLPKMLKAMDDLLLANLKKQKPLVIQPIWKTMGKSAQLHKDCFDIFVWSDFAFTRLFFDVAKTELDGNRSVVSRQVRAVVWLTKMLLDFSVNGKIDYNKVIDELSYNTKNDKAFSVNGRVTQPYMASDELLNPRIKRNELKNIILGGGQNMLSPERRLDGIIQSSLDLFD